jgi:hypothetical protein
MKCLPDDLELKAVMGNGDTWHYCGSRQDVEDWFNQWPGAKKMSITIRDKYGMVVGRKHFGEEGITWGALLSE